MPTSISIVGEKPDWGSYVDVYFDSFHRGELPLAEAWYAQSDTDAGRNWAADDFAHSTEDPTVQ